jgi:hypothetical protein
MTAPSIKHKNVHIDAELPLSEEQPSSDAQAAVQTPPKSAADALKRVVGTMVRWTTIGAMVFITLAWIAMLLWLTIALILQII